MRSAKFIFISIFCRDISRTSENRTWICMVSSNQSRGTGIYFGRSIQSWPRIRLWTWTLLERHNWSTYHLSSFRKWTWFGKINNILTSILNLLIFFFTSEMREKNPQFNFSYQKLSVKCIPIFFFQMRWKSNLEYKTCI